MLARLRAGADHTLPFTPAMVRAGRCLYSLGFIPGNPFGQLVRDLDAVGVDANAWRRAIEDAHATESTADAGTETPTPAAATDTTTTTDDTEVDPLDGLADRIRTLKRPELALDPVVVDAARDLRASDAPAFDVLRRELKAARVSVTAWDDAVNQRDREVRAEAKARHHREAIEQAQRARAARERQRTERVRELEQSRTDAGESLKAHYGEAIRDDVTYTMVPGRISCTMPAKNDQGESTTTLASFSAARVAQREEYALPDARPALEYVVSVCNSGDAAKEYSIPAADWLRCEWPERLGVRGTVTAGRGVRDQLRESIELLSPEPTIRRRYSFTGWVEHGSLWSYVHAGGRITAAGHSPDGATVSGHAAKYALPPPAEGEALRRGLEATMEFLKVKPAAVVVPLVAAVFRAPLGPSRGTIHITGVHGKGKTMLAKIAQAFFVPGAEPLSWADGSTANGLQSALAKIGDAVVVVDDLRANGTRHDSSFVLADRVIRARFNGASSAKLHRDGSARDTQPPRGYLISTGEVRPQGGSLRERLLSVELNERPSPDLSTLLAMAQRGELAGVMAAYLSCLAGPCAWRKETADCERGAAERLGVKSSDRTRGVVSELALGMEALTDLLARHELTLPEDEWRKVLRELAEAQGELVAEESPALRFPALVGESIREGRAHVRFRAATGTLRHPEEADRWGWRLEGSEWRSRGVCIGYLSNEWPGEIALDPGPSLRIAKDMAERDGHPLACDRTSLARDLLAAGKLAQTQALDASGRQTPCKQVRLSGGKLRALFIPIADLGVDVDGKAIERHADASPGGEDRVD